MKKIVFFVGILIIFASCGGKTRDISITIQDKEGIIYEAIVLPAADRIPATGDIVPIIKASSIFATSKYVYNSDNWRTSDTIVLGGIAKRKVVIGKVIEKNEN